MSILCPNICCVIGPTASGKTALSFELARKFNGEIISVDSRQIYCGMDIGTAKEATRPAQSAYSWDTPFLINNINHYLIDIIKPDQAYTAFDFKIHAQKLISNIAKSGKTPILVGGTGLYFNTLLFDYSPGTGTTNPELKLQLEKQYNIEGGNKLWQKLAELDPISANKIHPNNPRHLIRALEYCLTTGNAKSNSVQKLTEPVYKTTFYGINWPRKDLYDRINLRIDQQINNGLIEETQRLRNTYDHNLTSMSSLGYSEIGQALDGKISMLEAIDKFKQNTRRYAKRQITWFSHYTNVNWVNSEKIEI